MTKCLAPMWREEVTPLDPIFAVRAGAPEGREVGRQEAKTEAGF